MESMDIPRKKGPGGYAMIKHIANKIKSLRIANYGQPYDKRLGQKLMRALKQLLTRDDYRELYRTIRRNRFGKICRQGDSKKVLLYYYRAHMKRTGRMKAPIFFLLPNVNHCFCRDFKDHRKARFQPNICRHTAGLILAEAYNRFDMTYFADKDTFQLLFALRATGKSIRRHDLERMFF
uniref:SWIM-type domain-containing protein n=1 Tax=Panagrellus redivivus TaxID=6233 RepID=A0A7E4UYS5_PANRE